MVPRRVLACALVLTLATPAWILGDDGAAGGAAGEEGGGLGAKVLGWASEKLTGAVGSKAEELVFSTLLSGTPFASGDPNGPVLEELQKVEQKLDQISSQITALSQDLSAGLREVGCDSQASAYTTKVLISVGDRATLEHHAELLQRLADPSSNAQSRAEAQRDIRHAFANDSKLEEIHQRINLYAVTTVQAYHDAMRSCGRFLNQNRLQRIQDQYAWIAGLQVSSCQLVLNHYFDSAKTKGAADPTTDSDYKTAVSDCQKFVDALKPLAVNGSLPDDQTVYEIPTSLLWKLSGVQGGRWSCYGGFKCRGSSSDGCRYDTPCDNRDQRRWVSGNWIHLRIPDEISSDDCHDFCVAYGLGIPGAEAYTLQRQAFGDATKNLQQAGPDWLMPRETDVHAFIGDCSRDDGAATKTCLASEGFADSHGDVLGGAAGGFYLWALPDRWNPTRSRDRNVDFLWAMGSGTGPAFQVGDAGDAAAVVLVRDKPAGQSFILGRGGL